MNLNTTPSEESRRLAAMLQDLSQVYLMISPKMFIKKFFINKNYYTYMNKFSRK